MEEPFLRQPAGSDFVANPFTGLPEREGRTVVPDTPAGSPLSHFDLMALLGGPADIAAMQREIEATAGPLNLESPLPIPDEMARTAPLPAVPQIELPGGDEIAAMIAAALEDEVDHVSDRAAFCHRLGHAVARMMASAVMRTGPNDGVPTS